ncbi:hypothetical protein GCM10020254_81510 [Streptomyces goshikiensis]
MQRWLAVRGSGPWHEIPDSGVDGPVVPLRDGVAQDIRAFDGAIDPARAKGLLSALELLRADAARGARLDFALLSTWQQHILGTTQPPRFRISPAFAKGAGSTTASDRTRVPASTRAWTRAHPLPADLSA